MKTLLMVRHAKSSWANALLNDFDRTLNDRGHRDAPVMAQRMLIKNIQIDAFISSTAARAFTTATYFAEAYQQKQKDIIQVPELYHAGPAVFFKTITNIANAVQTAAVFSHNPGITEFVNQLTAVRIDDMPTCGIFAITVHTDNWKSFEQSPKEYLFFEKPKEG